MIKNIIKRDGRVIPFNKEKITKAILLAAKEVADSEGKLVDEITAEKITDGVIEYLNKKYSEDEIPTVESVQDAVVKILIESGHAKTSEKYILYRAERTRIRESKTRLMKSIEEITFADTKNADIKRENANVDGNTAMGSMLHYGSAISKEFCKNFVMKPEHTKSHEDGDIHIHDMDFLNMGTLTCCQIDLNKLFKNGFNTGHGFLREPNDIISYASLAAIAIQSDQNDQHGGQSIPTLDYGLAPGVKKTFRKLYRDNLYRALLLNELIKEDQKDEITKILDKLEIESKSECKLNLSESFKECEINILKNEFNLESSKAEKIHNFVYNETVKETNNRTYQAMEALIHNLNTMHSRAGAQVPFSSVNFGTDISPEGRMVVENLLLATEAGLGNGETPIFPILIFKVKEGINYNPGDPNYDLFKLSCRVSSKRLFPNFSFIDAPFNKQYYKEGKPETEVSYMGCRTRVLGNVCGEEKVTGRGNLSFTTINLPRLGIKHGLEMRKVGKETNFEEFYKDLDEKIDLVIEQLLERMKVQGAKRVKNFPFLMGQHVWEGSENLTMNDTLEEVIKQGTLTVGFIGLAECLVGLIGQHHGESEEAQKLGLEIIQHMRKRMDDAADEHKLNFSLIATPAEGLSGRFVNIDKKIYGEIKGITDKEYYTNSFHVPVYYKISAFDKIKKEAPYHELTNAGHISYVEVDGDPVKNLEAFESIVRAMKEYGIGYGSINHPVDRDPVCGYKGVIDGDICPSCGRKEFDNGIGFERIRRITGYLVGTLDRFNNAKAAEVRDRVKHSDKFK
ncbi:MAG: anaerobic ribonucleoside triphosphate reductase [Romboutsia sp.]|nr:anaerobic ribonucleoside triphosphate reductase [Romboutsia sp.]